MTADWRLHAQCRGLDPELFYPERGEDIRLAQSICRECSVSSECLDFAIENGEHHGIWGGLSERSRRRLRTERGLVVPRVRGAEISEDPAAIRKREWRQRQAVKG